MKELIKKLAAVKSEIGKITKDNTNPFYKSKYFDINTLLEQVEPLLQKNGLIVLQPIRDNKVNTAIYDIDSGLCIESYIELPEINDPQKLGSAITYYRRYTLQSLLSLQAEDDDGNKAIHKNKERSSTGNQGIMIDNLLRTANIPQNENDAILNGYESFDYEKAKSCIAYLQNNQLPGIENQNPSQTDIKEHLKTK